MSPRKNIRQRRFLVWLLPGCVLAAWLCCLRFEECTAATLRESGRRHLRERRDEMAESAFERCLQRTPNDAELILLWAQAVISGRNRTPQQAAELALTRLQQIPDSSPLAAEARMREGRLGLLVLQKPEFAEARLRKSLELGPPTLDACYLLWKLCDLTERVAEAEPWFWAAYELTPEEQQPERLREWYTSQFSPQAANAELDRLLGFLEPNRFSDDAVTLARLAAFRSHEPESFLTAAAEAHFMIHLRDRDPAIDLLLRHWQRPGANTNDFLMSTLVDVLLETGRLDEAQVIFERWTPSEGFQWLRTAGRMQQIVYQQDSEALELFERARPIWPGPIDWSLLHYEAQSLARLGRRSESESARARAKEIELLMELDVHRELRQALLDLRRPQNLQKIQDFYQKIGRDREANEWNRHRTRLF
jgi:tetratricopeptide (TPR) repeat protein